MTLLQALQPAVPQPSGRWWRRQPSLRVQIRETVSDIANFCNIGRITQCIYSISRSCVSTHVDSPTSGKTFRNNTVDPGSQLPRNEFLFLFESAAHPRIDVPG